MEDRVPAVGTALLVVVLLRKHSSQQGKPGLRGDASCYSSREAPGRWGICALLGVGSQTICAQGVPGRMLKAKGNLSSSSPCLLSARISSAM